MNKCLVIIVAVFGSCQAAKITDLVKPCSVRDPNLNQCLLELGKKVFPSAVGGSKELGFPPLDPLLVPEMVLQNSEGETVGLKLVLNNANHYGRKDTQIRSIKCNPKTLECEMETFIPVYNVIGEYTTSGRIVLLPINGHGAANLTFVELPIKYNFKLTPLEKKGIKYFTIENFKTTFDTSKVIVNLDNLFGNKQLSDTMNAFLNENWKIVYSEMRPNLLRTMSDIDSQLFNMVFSKIPAEAILKDFQ